MQLDSHRVSYTDVPRFFENSTHKIESKDNNFLSISNFETNSHHISKENMSKLFESHSENIKLFTGNLTSEKLLMFEIQSNEIRKHLHHHHNEIHNINNRTEDLAY